jgi:DNA-binding NarL/FixJ family response regulator
MIGEIVLPRVVAVSATPLFRLGVAAAFAEERGAELVATAATELALFEVLASAEVDVALVDADFPETDGLLLAAAVRHRYPACGAVLLAKSDDDLLLRALASGISAFVPTSADARVLVAAVRHAAQAPSSFSAPQLAEALNRRDRSRAVLSPREHEVLRYLHQGLVTAQIAARMAVTESTVKTYVVRLYDKIGVHNRSQALAATRDLVYGS